MKRLDRMVSSSFLRLFLVFVICAPALFILAELTDKLGRYLTLGLTGTEIAVAYLYRAPLFVIWSFPIAGLIAAVFTVHSMTVNREVVAAKAGGISFHRLIVPIGIWAAILSGVGVFLTDPITRSTRIANEMLRQETNRLARRASFVYQTSNADLLSVSALSAINGTMSSVVLETAPRTVGDEQLMRQIQAESATWTEESGWTFHDGYIRVFSSEGWERSYRFDESQVPILTEKPEELLETPREAEEMTYGELKRQVSILQRAGGEPRKLMVEGEQRWSIPIATLVVALFGAPLATTSKRGGAAFGIGVSLGTTIAYILMLRIAGALGEAGTLTPVVSAWLPNWLFLAVALVLLVRVRT